MLRMLKIVFLSEDLDLESERRIRDQIRDLSQMVATDEGREREIFQAMLRNCKSLIASCYYS